MWSFSAAVNLRLNYVGMKIFQTDITANQSSDKQLQKGNFTDILGQGSSQGNTHMNVPKAIAPNFPTEIG